MKNRMSLIWILCFFSLFYMFNAADAAEVYVVGNPTDLPEYNKNLPVTIKLYDAPIKGYGISRFGLEIFAIYPVSILSVRNLAKMFVPL